jgi:hypothetical protein
MLNSEGEMKAPLPRTHTQRDTFFFYELFAWIVFIILKVRFLNF